MAALAWSVLEKMGRSVTTGSDADADAHAVYGVQWLPEGKLLVRHTDATKSFFSAGGYALYVLKEGRWMPEAVPAPVPDSKSAVLAGGLKVSLRESANDPQVMVASDGAHEITLVGEDPQLQGIWRAKLEEVEWTERGGHVEKGGLLLPKEGSAPRPYPLVIQIDEGYIPNKFLPGGWDAAAYAAQALVARGMAVLEISSSPPVSYFASFKDEAGQPLTYQKAQWLTGPNVTGRVDAAVDLLARRGLIDRQRVGLVGFSFKGFAVSYVTTHPRQVIPAAAIVADSALRIYSESATYRAAFWDDAGTGQQFDEYYGGSFWEEASRARWLEHAPAFNVNHLETPLLLIYHDSMGGDYLSEMIGPLRANHREFDFMQIQNSDHQLARPRQLEASLQTTLDWMSFWLTGREDADPAKADQYWYWRSLRAHKAERQGSKQAVTQAVP